MTAPAEKHAADPPSWLADTPVDLQVPGADQLGVRPMVDQIGSLLDKAPTPFTISLSGGWGVGKSTIAEALCKARVARGLPACVVDAWTTEIKDLRRSIAIEVGVALRGEAKRKSIADRLDRGVRVTRSRQLPAQIEFRGFGPAAGWVKEHWRSFGSAFAVFTIAAILAALLTTEPWQTVFTTVAATLAPLLVTAGFVTIITPSESEAPAAESVELAAAFREIVTDQTGGHSPVLVVVDNLDRLPGGEALAALSQIRSLVEINGSRCVFLVPIDRGRLVEHLSPVLGSEASGVAAAGDFLHKFFNVELALTDPEPLDLSGLAQRHAAILFPDVDADQVASAARVVATAAGRVPRAVSRLLNGLSTRYRVLVGREDVPTVELARLAFVEGFVAVAPLAASSLAREPRRFIQARAAFHASADEGEKSRALSSLYRDANAIGTEWEAMRRFLIANADVPLTASDLRLALTLREDRVWSGVDDPQTFVEALEAGDADAFLRGVSGSLGQRELILGRSVHFIQARHDNGLPELSLLGIRAMSEVLEETPAIHAQLGEIALADLPLVSPRFSRSLGDFTLAFAYRYAATQEPAVRKKLADVLTNEISSLRGDPEPLTPLIGQLRRIGDWVTNQDEVRESLKDRPDDEVAALFDLPPLVAFASGPLAEAYLTFLAGWSPAGDAPSKLRAALLASRLRILHVAGWDAGNALALLATRIRERLPEYTSGDESLRVFKEIADLLATEVPGSEIDELAVAAASHAVGGDGHLFDLALRLPMGPNAAQTVSTSLLQWAAQQPSDIAGRLVEEHRKVLEQALPDLADRLISIWVARDEPEYARLAIDGSSDAADRLVAGVDRSPESKRVALLTQAVSVLGRSRENRMATVLEGSIAALVRSAPVGALAGLPDLVAQMRRGDIPRARTVDALVDRVRSLDADDLNQVQEWIRVFEATLGSQQRQRLHDAVLERLNSLKAET